MTLCCCPLKLSTLLAQCFCSQMWAGILVKYLESTENLIEICLVKFVDTWKQALAIRHVIQPQTCFCMLCGVYFVSMSSLVHGWFHKWQSWIFCWFQLCYCCCCLLAYVHDICENVVHITSMMDLARWRQSCWRIECPDRWHMLVHSGFIQIAKQVTK